MSDSKKRPLTGGSSDNEKPPGQTRLVQLTGAEWAQLNAGQTIALSVVKWPARDTNVLLSVLKAGRNSKDTKDSKESLTESLTESFHAVVHPSSDNAADMEFCMLTTAKNESSTPLHKTLVLLLGEVATNAGIEQVLYLEELLPADWRVALYAEFAKPYWRALTEFLLDKDRQGRYIYPPIKDVFAAFYHCTIDATKVCIVGQDPYHSPGQAHGLSFSVPDGVAVPSSLSNIYQELKTDIPGYKRPQSGNLEHWAKQGVLLLNTALTVTHQQPASHSNSGWSTFTAAVIKLLDDQKQHVVYLSWGRHAQSQTESVSTQNNLVLTAAHPSGFSANKGFFGCRHFSKCNAYLKSKKLPAIQW